MYILAAATTGGVSDQIQFGKTATSFDRQKDSIVDLDHVWKAKKNSISLDKSKVCFRNEKFHRNYDTMKLCMETAYPAKPTNRVYSFGYSHPPNPTGVRPHPHKRFNMEYRPFNVVSGIPSNTEDFYMQN